MAWIRLINKAGDIVDEETNYRLETSGGLRLPRQIEYGGKVYVFDRLEKPVNIYTER